jgi:opacity protein-like surface antigen
MRLKTTLLASAAGAALLAAIPAAQAGGYVSIFGGWNLLGNDVGARAGAGTATYTTTRTHGSPTTHTDTVTFSFGTTFSNSGAKARDGFVLGAAVGGDLGWLPNLRGEFELAFRRSKLGRASAFASVTDTVDTVVLTSVVHPTGTITFTGTLTGTAAAASNDGSVRTFTLMANAWYDVDMGSNFKPYVGGGVGYADNEVKHGLVFNGSGGDFAWQLGAGVNYQISEKTSVGLGYRYLDAGDVTLLLAPRAGGPVLTETYDITHHSALVNLNFKLGK